MTMANILTEKVFLENYEKIRQVAESVCWKMGISTDYVDDVVSELFLRIKTGKVKIHYSPKEDNYEGFFFSVMRNIGREIIREGAEMSIEDIIKDDGTSGDVAMDLFAVSEDKSIESVELEERRRKLEKIKNKLENNNQNGNIPLVEEYMLKTKSKSSKRIIKREDNIENLKRSGIFELKEKALRYGISRAQLADLMGITPQRLNAYLKGVVKNIPDTIRRKVDELLDTDLSKMIKTGIEVDEHGKVFAKDAYTIWMNALEGVYGKDCDREKLKEILSTVLGIKKNSLERWRNQGEKVKYITFSRKNKLVNKFVEEYKESMNMGKNEVG